MYDKFKNVYLNHKKFLLKKTDINIHKKNCKESNTKIGQKQKIKSLIITKMLFCKCSGQNSAQ